MKQGHGLHKIKGTELVPIKRKYGMNQYVPAG